MSEPTALDPTIVVPPDAQEADVRRAIKHALDCAALGAFDHVPGDNHEALFLAALHSAGYVIEPGWQPISSAPNDRDVLGWAPTWRAPMAMRAGYTGTGATMWRPLPAPPQQQEQP